eukprot:GEMP01101129.1.p2 GENE.GEMP01101129.1~~GEMP01101129.1.p2  ORF type:complete len:105 (+),score=26.99 GEMP01101129.1:31-345(+)
MKMLLYVAVACAALLRGQTNLGAVSPSLHREMKEMMQEPETDGSAVKTTKEYSDSSSALSEALGPGWNGPKLEKQADDAKNSLLQGIANPKAVKRMTAMLSALA